VDVVAGERAVELMRASVARAQRPEVVGGIGGFAGLFDLSAAKDYARPLLATSTDGVGTKVAIARALDQHTTIGRDLVAMIIDDIVVCGAEPLFLTDYIACGKVDPDRIADIVAGIAAGCAEADVALIGGETAEHPGLMAPDEYDLAGAGTGLVEADRVLGPHRVGAGDVLVGLEASGLHSNGYSLARAVLHRDDPAALREHVPELGRTIGAELLEPTRIYTPLCLSILRAGAPIRAMAHITGGGLAANIARVIPDRLTAVVDRGSWRPLPVFPLIAQRGSVPRAEMETAFNMGVGMVLVAGPAALTVIFEQAARYAVPARVIGQVREPHSGDEPDSPAKGGTGGTVMLVGDHPG
jgi:phosphoribosylformylglycinamidine cyclo-ligase